MATTIFRGLEHSIGEEIEEGRKYGVNSQHADQHACHNDRCFFFFHLLLPPFPSYANFFVYSIHSLYKIITFH